MKFIKFNRTIVGWYNFVFGINKYNVNPETFRSVTGVGKNALMGMCEVSEDELEQLRGKAILIGLADGWEIVPSDDYAEVVS